MARTNSVITTDINTDIGQVTFHVAGAGSLTVYVDRLSEANRRYGLLHGIKQRVCDAAALESIDQGPGKKPLKPTPGEKLAAMQLIVEHLNSGAESWSTRGERSEGEGSLLFRALVRAGADAQIAREKIRGWSRSEQASVLASAKIKPHADAIRSEMGKSAPDAEELLGDLI